MSDAETDKLVRELIRYGNGKKKQKAGFYFLHIVRNKKDPPNDSLQKIENFLFQKGVPEHLLPCLPYLKENTAACANALCDMVIVIW